MKTRFEVFRSKNGQWCWHARRGSKIVADGAESYKRRLTLLKSLKALLNSVRIGGYTIDEGEGNAKLGAGGGSRNHRMTTL